jgi:hypothetical protein
MGMEHRWGRRESTDITVQFLTRCGTVGSGRVLNISSTGAYLQTTVSLPLNSLIYLEPTAPMPVVGNIRRIAASVVRQDAWGAGLEWCETVNPGNRFELHSYPIAANECDSPAA